MTKCPACGMQWTAKAGEACPRCELAKLRPSGSVAQMTTATRTSIDETNRKIAQALAILKR